jgi:hypothetical protein
MDTMNLRPLHPSITDEIIHLYEGGLEALDIQDQLGGRLSLDEIKSTLSDYNVCDPDQYTGILFRGTI